MKTFKYLGITIAKHSNSRYVIEYGGEDFVFASFSAAAGWAKMLRLHEEKEGYERTIYGIVPKGESNAPENEGTC